jgi:predicted transporter
MKMKKLIAGLVLLTGFTSPAFAHTLSIHEGMAAFYHHMHHVPFTLLLIVIGVALIRSWRKKTL